jgi:ParB/Sulfiredoxin domain
MEYKEAKILQQKNNYMNDKKILLINIRINTWNPNEMTKQEFAELIKEIQHLGKLPKKMILRRKEGFYEIVDGEHSFKALQELGIQELQEDWYEIVDIDDVEAKRQTYKRNLGGKNNPVKLGLMFLKAKEESGLSNRELADKWEVSEGMVRNYLMYAEVGRLRNDYATIAKLTVEQIRIYLKISEYAKPIADYWLYCGALKDALLVFRENNETYEKANYDVMGTIKNHSLKIMNQGFDKVIPKKWLLSVSLDLTKKEKERNLQKFKTVFNIALGLSNMIERMEKYFVWPKNTTKDYILEYLAIYYDRPMYITENWMIELFSTIIRETPNNFEFMLTPKEIEECTDKESGKKGLSYILENVKEIIKAKYNIPTYEIKESWESLEDKLNRLEIERTAPDYIKTSKEFSFNLKLAFLKIKFTNEENRKQDWDILSNNSKERDFKDINPLKTEKAQQRMLNIIESVKYKEKKKKEITILADKSEQELAKLFVEKLRPITKGDKEFEEDLMPKLVKTFSKHNLHLLVFLVSKYYDEVKWKQYIEEISKQMHSSLKRGESTK